MRLSTSEAWLYVAKHGPVNMQQIMAYFGASYRDCAIVFQLVKTERLEQDDKLFMVTARCKVPQNLTVAQVLEALR